MAYVDAEARQELLDSVATAINQIGAALATFGELYEQLDERSADVLEEQLFRPAQIAYGRAKRTHADFATRYALRRRTFAPVPSREPASAGARALLEAAIDAVGAADESLASLQDSLLPVEVGDPELRAGLAEVRRLLGDVPERGRRFEQVRGR